MEIEPAEEVEFKSCLVALRGRQRLTSSVSTDHQQVVLDRRHPIPVEPWEARLEEAGLDFVNKAGVLKVRITSKELTENGDLIRELLHEVVLEDEKE
jgi:hypothetical protein